MKRCLETMKKSTVKLYEKDFTFQNKIWSSEQYYDLDISLL